MIAMAIGFYYMTDKTQLALIVGAFLYIEIQRGKIPMQKKKWSRQLGGTAGCTLRLAEASQYSSATKMRERKEAKENGKRETFLHDSWFTSVKSVKGVKRELGHESFGVLKTNYSGTPKEELEKIMKDWPSGSQLVMECKEHGMFICAYKYSHRKKGEFKSIVIICIFL